MYLLSKLSFLRDLTHPRLNNLDWIPQPDTIVISCMIGKELRLLNPITKLLLNDHRFPVAEQFRSNCSWVLQQRIV